MRYGVLGTGAVGRTIGAKLISLGHQVCLGSRTEANSAAVEWADRVGGDATTGTFETASDFGERLFNCLPGVHVLEVVSELRPEVVADKLMVDVSNPLDFSRGFPPSLSVSNTDSLGEQIQRALPQVSVVKALNTVTAGVMVEPTKVPGRHNVFLAGNNAGAKGEVRSLLGDFGWMGGAVIDLGGIEGARAAEMYLPLWLQLMTHLGSADFNIQVVDAGGPTG